MSPSPQPNFQSELDRLDAATDDAIAACDGDLRSTVRSLIVANEFLEYEFRELLGAVSAARVGDSKMSEVTYFVALPFVAIDDGLAPGEAYECRTPAQALRRAEALAAVDEHVGAVAFSRTGNLATGIFSDAQVIKSFGDVPTELIKQESAISLHAISDWND